MHLAWTTWAAGVIVLGTLITLNVTLFVIAPEFFLSDGGLVTIGWPAVFLVAQPGEPLDLRWLSLVVDLTALWILVGGTMVGVERCTAGVFPSPRLTVRWLIVTIATLAVWWALFRMLSVHWIIFLGWAALFAVLLSVPFVCNTLLPSEFKWTWPRFGLRKMFLVVTWACAIFSVGAMTGEFGAAFGFLVLSYFAWNVARSLKACVRPAASRQTVDTEIGQAAREI
jgi:hypothetical protein